MLSLFVDCPLSSLSGQTKSVHAQKPSRAIYKMTNNLRWACILVDSGCFVCLIEILLSSCTCTISNTKFQDLKCSNPKPPHSKETPSSSSSLLDSAELASTSLPTPSFSCSHSCCTLTSLKSVKMVGDYFHHREELIGDASSTQMCFVASFAGSLSASLMMFRIFF